LYTVLNYLLERQCYRATVRLCNNAAVRQSVALSLCCTKSSHYAQHAFRITLLLMLFTSVVSAEELRLQELIDEALKNNHEILMAEAKWKTSTFRIPQVKSLPDPIFMIGYQNEGWKRYTFGEMEGAQWMFSASQMFPFPGKLSLKGEMAERDSEVLKYAIDSVRLNVIKQVRELYYDLYLAYKEIDLIRERAGLFKRIEDAALARYSSGMAPQQEVLMAQTEKYMLLEKEEMLKQKIQSIEAMLNATLGRDVYSPLGRPAEPARRDLKYSIDELISLAHEASPSVKSKEKMVSAGKVRVAIAEKEYYPDFTLTGTVMKRAREFEDMWNLTMAVNIPIFYKTKQRQALNEARSLLSETEHELEATRIMLSSEVRDNYSMLKTAERLMELYKSGLIQKTYQDFELALTGYVTGKVEAITVISRLKALLDYETQYWRQYIEREKAIARIEAITGIRSQ
ncbi:MAG: TolC family protein, partial [Thermodesulfovibrionales bacterium]